MSPNHGKWLLKRRNRELFQEQFSFDSIRDATVMEHYSEHRSLFQCVNVLLKDLSLKLTNDCSVLEKNWQ